MEPIPKEEKKKLFLLIFVLFLHSSTCQLDRTERLLLKTAFCLWVTGLFHFVIGTFILFQFKLSKIGMNTIPVCREGFLFLPCNN